MFASQIKETLVAMHAPAIDRIGAMLSSTNPRVGVRLAGPDDQLITALMVAFRDFSVVRDPYIPTPGQLAPPAEIFVGIKPIPAEAIAARAPDKIAPKPIAPAKRKISRTWERFP